MSSGRFRVTIPGLDSSGFNTTADISSRARNQSLNRDLESRKILGDLVNEGNKVKLTQRQQELDAERLRTDTQLQLAQLESQAQQTAAQLAVQAKDIQARLIQSKAQNIITREEGVLNRQGQSDLQGQRNAFDLQLEQQRNAFTSQQAGETRTATERFNREEGVLNRQGQSDLQGQRNAFDSQLEQQRNAFLAEQANKRNQFEAEQRAKDREARILESQQGNNNASPPSVDNATNIASGGGSAKDSRAAFNAAQTPADIVAIEKGVITGIINGLIEKTGKKDFVSSEDIAAVLLNAGADNVERALGEEGTKSFFSILNSRTRVATGNEGEKFGKEIGRTIGGKTLVGKTLSFILGALGNLGDKTDSLESLPERLEKEDLELAIDFLNKEIAARSPKTER